MSIFHKLKNEKLMENLNDVAEMEITFTPDKKILGGAYLTFYGEMEGEGILTEKTALTKVNHRVANLRCGGKVYKVVCLGVNPNLNKGEFIEMTAEIKDIRVKVKRKDKVVDGVKVESKKKNESRLVRRYIYKSHNVINISMSK